MLQALYYDPAEDTMRGKAGEQESRRAENGESWHATNVGGDAMADLPRTAFDMSGSISCFSALLLFPMYKVLLILRYFQRRLVEQEARRLGRRGQMITAAHVKEFENLAKVSDLKTEMSSGKFKAGG